jgi:hypothetical protein
MKFFVFLLKINTHNSFILVTLIGLFLIALLAYFIIMRLDRKIFMFYPRNRSHFETSAIKRINEEYFKQGKLIEAFKFVIKITIEIRNLVQRLSGELKNIENIYNELKPFKNSDLDILKELKSSMEVLHENLERLSISKKEDLNKEFIRVMSRLSQVLLDCDRITDKILKLETEKNDKIYISEYVGQIDSNCKIIKDLHDELIKYAQELFSKNI